MLKYYTASCLHHYKKWTHEFDPLHCENMATWPSVYALMGGETNATWLDFRGIWYRDIEDVRLADVVLCYHEPGDLLRGALVEAGAGIGMGKHIILVGDTVQWGTWKHHPLVTQVQDLAMAELLMRRMAGTT